MPELENMGLYMFKIWHIAYGDYPIRQLEFVTEDLDTIREVFASDRWAIARKPSQRTDHRLPTQSRPLP